MVTAKDSRRDMARMGAGVESGPVGVLPISCGCQVPSHPMQQEHYKVPTRVLGVGPGHRLLSPRRKQKE